MSESSISGAAVPDTEPQIYRWVRPSRLADLFIRTVVAGLVVVVVVLAGTGAVTATTQGVESLDRSRLTPDLQHKKQFETIRRELAAKVPRGSRVYPPPNLINDEWQQRIAEFAVMSGVVVVDDPRKADFTLSFVDADDAYTAGGVHLVAVPVG
jgi:hypothetical protein